MHGGRACAATRPDRTRTASRRRRFQRPGSRTHAGSRPVRPVGRRSHRSGTSGRAPFPAEAVPCGRSAAAGVTADVRKRQPRRPPPFSASIEPDAEQAPCLRRVGQPGFDEVILHVESIREPLRRHGIRVHRHDVLKARAFGALRPDSGAPWRSGARRRRHRHPENAEHLGADAAQRAIGSHVLRRQDHGSATGPAASRFLASSGARTRRGG